LGERGADGLGDFIGAFAPGGDAERGGMDFHKMDFYCGAGLRKRMFPLIRSTRLV
jgi:hypothetical protein